MDKSDSAAVRGLRLPAMGLAIGAYRAVEHLGVGPAHRSSPVWRAQDARTVEDVALTVLPVEESTRVHEIVELVDEVRHPHLLPVSDLVEDDDRVALICPWPRGGRLIELVRRRGRLSAGETVTVVLPLAAALAEVHRAGVRHGGVCPEAIWFDARGRPLLVPLAVGMTVATVVGPGALGTADVAPEVLRQARTGPAGPPADVFSLASVALFCLTGSSAWPAEEPADVLVQSAAGQWPDPPEDAGPPPLLALLRAMLRADPAARPDADDVVRRLSTGAPVAPEAIRFGAGPCPTPASSKRWRGWANHAEPAAPANRSAAHPSAAHPSAANPGAAHASAAADPDPDPTVGEASVPDTDRGSVRGPRPAVPDRPPPAGPVAEPAGPAGPPSPSARRRGPLVRLTLALLSGLLVTVLVAQVGQWIGDPPSTTVAAPAATDWTQVITDLDRARSRALAAGDPALLAQVYLPGSAAAAADTATIDTLSAHGWRVVDGYHDIVSVSVLAGAEAGAGSSADAATDPVRVAVVDTLAARPVVDGAGQQVSTTAARGEQRRVLLLTATDAGYRISAIEPG